MGTISAAVEAANVPSPDLVFAAIRAESAARRAQLVNKLEDDNKIEEVAIFVAASDRATFSMPLDLKRDVEEIEKLIAVREMALPKIAWKDRRNPERGLCLGVSYLLRTYGRREPVYPPEREHVANIALVADALRGTTSENRNRAWTEARGTPRRRGYTRSGIPY